MGLQFKNGKLGFSKGGKLAFNKRQANKCECCHQCYMNSKSQIQGYFYTQYINGMRLQEYIGVGNFHKQPLQTCCWCQEYINNVYDPQTQTLLESRRVVGGGTQIGFCYTEWGWWDGNEAGRTEPDPPGIYVGLDPEGGGKAVTYFNCGQCCGQINVRYYYVRPNPGDPGIEMYADVSFYVYNPECCYEEDVPCEYRDA